MTAVDDPLNEARCLSPTNCLVCDGPYQPAARLPGLFRCSDCGFVSADMSVSDAELLKIYGEDYFHGGEYQDYIAEENALRLNFRDRLSTLRPLVRNWPHVDLFEIGCAYGFFLSEVSDELDSAQGIDMCQEAVDYAARVQGVDARQADFLSLDLEQPVDIIALWDTIEHLKRPDLFISKAASDLKTGGTIVITTGDIGSLNARLRGKSWRMIHPPSHLHYFSVPTLSKLLRRHGFEIVHVSHPGNSRNLRSMLHSVLALKQNKPHLYDAVQAWPIWNYRLTLNLFDIMYVIGRKV